MDLIFFKKLLSLSTASSSPYFMDEFGDLLEVTPIPKLYKDSSHAIYCLKFAKSSEKLVMKLCAETSFSSQDSTARQDTISCQNAFWQGVEHLFNLRICQSLKYVEKKAQWLDSISAFAVSDYLVVDSIAIDSYVYSFQIMRCVLDGPLNFDLQTGRLGFQSEELVDRLVTSLSKHLLGTSGQDFPRDAFTEADVYLNLADGGSAWWRAKVWSLLQASVKPKISMAEWDELQQVFDQNFPSKVERWKPVVLDFRWDQVLVSERLEKITLLDLDALVIAPTELEWVMLEVVLETEVFEKLLLRFQAESSVPQIENHRLVYRALCFAMNLTGESSWQVMRNLPKILP